MAEGSILPSLKACAPSSDGHGQGWERPQEGWQGSHQFTFVYFCNIPSSIGKILEVAKLK